MSSPAAALEPGQVVERRLGPGETQAFEVELSAGRAYRVAVEQLGVDLVTEVRSAGGGLVAAVDYPFNRRGVESLLVVPSRTAEHRIEVRPQEAGAPPGAYRILVEELPWGGAGDRRRLAAEQALTRAATAYLEGTPESRRRALAGFEEALAHQRALGDRESEAKTLYVLAVVARLVDETAKALEHGRQARELWRAEGNRFWEAAALHELGLDHWLRGRIGDARKRFDGALAIRRQVGDRHGEALSLSNLCLMDLVEGELRRGVACYRGVLPILREVRAVEAEIGVRTSVGRAFDVLGEPEEALEHYRRALALVRSTGSRLAEGRTLNNLAVLYRGMGDFRRALEHYGRALEIFRELADRRWQARVLNNLGHAYYVVGENRRALSYLEQALPLWRAVGSPGGEASTLMKLGVVLGELGRISEAIAHHRQALELRRGSGDTRGAAVTLSRLGRAHLRQGDAHNALEACGTAVTELEDIGDRPEEATARYWRGLALEALGRRPEAAESLRAAAGLAREIGHRPIEAQARYRLAKVEHELGHRREAAEHVDSALAIVEGLRAEIQDPDLRSSYASMQHAAYELRISLWMEHHRSAPDVGYDREALVVSERSRARTLVELLNEAGADLGPRADPALAERRRSLLLRLNAKAARLESGGSLDDGERATLVAEQYEILLELDRVEAAMRERHPAFASLTRPAPLAADRIRGLLDAGTALLSYSLGETRSFLWVVTAEDVDVFELPGRSTIETAARELHRQLARHDAGARRRLAELAAELGGMLVGPALPRLDRPRLAIVADGALNYLPFGALRIPGASGDASAGETLVRRYEIVYLPSASALDALRRTAAGRPPASAALAVLADPVFDSADPRVEAGTAQAGGEIAERRVAGTAGAGVATPRFERLPSTRREAAEILELAPSPEVHAAFDFDAGREWMLGDRLTEARVVHLATHGVLDVENPALSGLVLSTVDRRGRPRDGFLRLRDVYGLRLRADLVVLSGCRTALGKAMRGEGLVGLTRGFMYAGAPRVVASLWRVEDRATAALMERFYRGLWRDGLRPAAALRAAQLAIAEERRWRDPYFWAAFVFQGEWR